MAKVKLTAELIEEIKKDPSKLRDLALDLLQEAKRIEEHGTDDNTLDGLNEGCGVGCVTAGGVGAK